MTGNSLAQRSKVQSAWRNLSDYEETLKEGHPEISYLQKANEAIDLALQNPDTKNQAKTHAYKLRISYAMFQNELNNQSKQLESIGDKNERLMTAYGKTELKEFETAVSELSMIRDLDPKFLDNIQKGLQNGAGNLDEDELKFAMAAQQMKIEAANIANGKYRTQNYGAAADYFYRTAVMNSILYNTMDTSNFYNACISAVKSKDPAKVTEYNKKMIDAKIALAYNYEALHNVLLEKGDTTGAAEILKKGRQAFPGDAGLLTQETNLFLGMGKQADALVNLQQTVQKDPNNALYYFMMGMIYDNMGNPKDKATGKELPRPSNFEDLFKKAEENYLKAISLKTDNKDYHINSLFNLGAMYNNYGGSIAAQPTGKGTEAARIQKENETKAQEYYKKAIPYLEQALSYRPDDKAGLTALRRLYLLTGQKAKADEIGAKLK